LSHSQTYLPGSAGSLLEQDWLPVSHCSTCRFSITDFQRPDVKITSLTFPLKGIDEQSIPPSPGSSQKLRAFMPASPAKEAGVVATPCRSGMTTTTRAPKSLLDDPNCCLRTEGAFRGWGGGGSRDIPDSRTPFFCDRSYSCFEIPQTSSLELRRYLVKENADRVELRPSRQLPSITSLEVGCQNLHRDQPPS
jgi:hypothetical protein